MSWNMMKYGDKRHKRGFALAEAIMATVILGFAAAAVLLPFTAAASAQSEGDRRTLSAKLASDMMENIVHTSFDQIISTYNGYTEAEGQVKDVKGNVFSDETYRRFSRGTECHNVYLAQESGKAASNVILATVTVSYDGKPIAIIKRFIGK